MKMEQPLSEARRMLAGLRDMERLLSLPDDCTLGLGVFSANASVLDAGAMSRYLLTVANSAAASRWTSIRVHLSAQGVVIARLLNHVFIRSGSMLTIELSTDWTSRAVFEIEGVRFAPDEHQYAPSLPPGDCVLEASVKVDGTWIKSLRVVQHAGRRAGGVP